MPSPGEPRLVSSRLGLGVVVVVLAAIGGAWWWRHRAGEPRATQAVTRPQTAGPAAPGHGAGPAARVAPAALTVTVRDGAGPLADAVVRLAPRDGEVVVITTGRDGAA